MCRKHTQGRNIPPQLYGNNFLLRVARISLFSALEVFFVPITCCISTKLETTEGILSKCHHHADLAVFFFLPFFFQSVLCGDNNVPPYTSVQCGRDVTTCPCVRPLPKHPQKGGVKEQGGYFYCSHCGALSSPEHHKLHWRRTFQQIPEPKRLKSPTFFFFC